MSQNSKAWGVAAALALSTGLIAIDTASAIAAPVPPVVRQVYAGGATFPELYYRRIMNCFGSNAGGTLTPAAPASCTTPVNSSITLWYAGVGSGNGKKAWGKNDAGGPGVALTFAAGYPAVNCRAPDASPTTTPFYDDAVANPNNRCSDPYPTGKFTFAGSDDPITTADLTDATFGYNTNSNGWGDPKVFPLVVGGVALAFKPAAVWNENGPNSVNQADGGQSSKLDLPTAVWCKIFTGQITDWNDPAITAVNPNLTGGASSPIAIFGRSDSSGTTFLFSNALINQCGALLPVGWSTSPNNSYFVNLGALKPANMTLVSGSGAVKSNINATAGSIGYLTSDQVKPYDATGPVAANVQSFYTFDKNKAAEYFSVAGPAITNAVKKLKAPANCVEAGPYVGPTASNCLNNPFNWTKTEPKPGDKKAYPIAGFTFAFTYTCFAHQDDVDALIRKSPGTNLGFFQWYFGKGFNTVVKPVATAGGFAVVPGPWKASTTKLLATNTNTKLGTPGAANTGCASVAGAGANL